MKHREVEQIRRERGRSMLLFLTDRCPVGCAHCSVDSRPGSPTITDYGLFAEIVDWISGRAGIEVVGISGGEPFVERRGLLLASRRFSETGKRQVVFTSGVWASRDGTPEWVREVLRRCSCVYLSTDSFHAPGVDDARFVRALCSVAAAGAWIVVQALDDGSTTGRVEALLREAFGESADLYAEVNRIAPLANGRGRDVFAHTSRHRGEDFGPCALALSPMIRYDGMVTGCCNESVIMGHGPERLRRRASSGEEVGQAVARFHNDPLLRVIAGAGLGALTLHPRFAALAGAEFAVNCDLCWRMLDQSPESAPPDRLVEAISELRVLR